MFNKKEKQLILYLIQEKERFVTSHEIVEQLSCSDRTVRTYARHIHDELDTYPGVEIVSKPGQGYQLQINDYQQFQTFLEDFQLEDHRLAHYGKADMEDRVSYILNKLLFEQEEVYFDDLAEEFFVSRSTLSADFKKIRQQFERYDLKIESKANKGVFVSGTERNKRRFIMDYFFDNRFVNTLHQYIDSAFFQQKITFEELMIIVLDECREGALKLSDFVIQNLIIHIALALRRVSEGFQINQLDNIEDIKDCKSRKIAKRIINRVEIVTGISIPAEEIDYITLHLIAKGNEGKGDRLVSSRLEERLRAELIQAVDVVGQPFSHTFQQDFQLIEGLVTHLETLFVRLNNKIILENPLLRDIQTNYKESLEMTRQIMEAVPTFREYHLSEDELAYIALHFLASIERFKEKSKQNILVICATGYGSAQMLKSRIENELGNLVSIVDVIGYYEINDQKLENIDFIISSIDLSNLIFNIPVYTVSVFLKEEEVRMIKEEIKTTTSKSQANEVDMSTPKYDLQEIFDEYCSEDTFFIYPSIDRDGLLAAMVQALAPQEDNQFGARMLQLMDQRESLSSVIFSPQIAVPHPIQPVGRHHRMAIALVKDGLYWNAEYPTIQFVFLPSLSVYDNEGLPHLTARIVDLVDNPERQEALLNCNSFEEFRKLFLTENGR
ncbi:BglG family transcription antiterminator [Streptococcus caprae]|uniref:BglG family transcription antiterminator n=1 Tax=Streptococcus caprae TaxID=1640501 RepID=A0ABV8CXU8_9STRE